MEEINNIIPLEIRQNYSELAVNKISDELEKFSGGVKEKAVSEFVASTITYFCKENERFAEAVYKTQRTLSDCCAEVMDGSGNQISDIDVYRGAVRHYFPNADISFKMEISIYGEDPTDEELTREPKKKAPASRRSKKEADEDIEENEDDEIDDTEIETPKVPKKPAEKTKKVKVQNKSKQEVIQISLFESLAGEE